jgi:phosphate transport system ATP-binding protein
MPHIQVRNLSVWYGDFQVLKDITVDIPDKQITCIIGPSGCGKTTLLKSMNRLLELMPGARVKGTVLVDGEDIYANHVDVVPLRKKMGLLGQKPQPLPMSIYENVAFGPRVHGTRSRQELNAIVERYLSAAGLWDEVKDRLHAPASQLSVGQQQRLCLARGLAVEPEVILCDEPTAALDPVSAQTIERRLKELSQNYTILVVTHILRQAKRLADHALFLYMGELIEAGPARDMFESPVHPQTRAYVNGDIS